MIVLVLTLVEREESVPLSERHYLPKVGGSDCALIDTTLGLRLPIVSLECTLINELYWYSLPLLQGSVSFAFQSSPPSRPVPRLRKGLSLKEYCLSFNRLFKQ